MVREFAAVILWRMEKLGCTIEKMQPGDPFLFPTMSVLSQDCFSNKNVK